MKMSVSDALRALFPNGAGYHQKGHEYSGLIWLDETLVKPTEDEINAKIAELQADYDADKYQRLRAANYPSWQDQLDKIYHKGIDAWKADIQKIKDQFPKP